MPNAIPTVTSAAARFNCVHCERPTTANRRVVYPVSRRFAHNRCVSFSPASIEATDRQILIDLEQRFARMGTVKQFKRS